MSSLMMCRNYRAGEIDRCCGEEASKRIGSGLRSLGLSITRGPRAHTPIYRMPKRGVHAPNNFFQEPVHIPALRVKEVSSARVADPS